MKEGQLDRGLSALHMLAPPCATRREVLALRLQLMLELDDVEAAQPVAKQLLGQPGEDEAARRAREALSREPPRDTLGATQTLWRQATEATQRGDTVAGARLFARALHALERLAKQRAALDAFYPQSTGDWRGGTGYQPATSIRTGEVYTLMLRFDAAADAPVEPWFALRGGESFPAAFARAGERIVVASGGGLSLYQGMNAPAQSIHGTWARFTPGGDRLLVLDGAAVRVVDASTAKTLSEVKVENPIASLYPQDAWLDDTRLFMSGDCARESKASTGPVCTLVIDTTAARVLVDRASVSAELSPSKRYVALMELQPNANGFPSGLLTVWDRQTRKWSAPVDAGSLFPSPSGIQFGRHERRVLLFEPGLSGLNTYTGRKLLAAVDIATGKKGPPPLSSEVVPADGSERWDMLSPSLKPLATAPRALVPTQRGPGRSHGFVETHDGRTIAVLEGIVEPAWAGVTTRAPHILLADARTKRLRTRIELPVDPQHTFMTAILALLPDDRTLHLCLDGEAGESFLIDMPSSSITNIDLGCYQAEVSGDGSALVAERVVVDLASKRTHPISFAASVELMHAAGTDDARSRLQKLSPSQLFCRAGGFLAPRDVCRARNPTDDPSPP